MKLKKRIYSLKDADGLKRRLLDDPYAVAYHEMSLKFEEIYLSCQILDTGTTYMPVQYAWAIRKDSPFFQLFDYHIRTLQETGTFQRYVRSYAGQIQVCPDYSGTPITSTQSFSAFIIMVTGVGISMICLG